MEQMGFDSHVLLKMYKNSKRNKLTLGKNIGMIERNLGYGLLLVVQAKPNFIK